MYRTLFFIVILCLYSSVLVADNLNLSEDFFRLSLNDQKKVIEKNFCERISFSQNMCYRSEVILQIRKNVGGQEGAIVPSSTTKRNFSCWLLKGNYRIDVDVLSPDSEKSVQQIKVCWDAQEGVLQNTFQSDRIKGRLFARIDTSFDMATSLNDAYAFWLHTGSTEMFPKPHYLFTYLLSQIDKWNVAVLPENNRIQITVSYDPEPRINEIVNRVGTLSIILDLSKNFMPVQGKIRGDALLKNGHELWREEYFYVEESELFDKVWMPTRIKECVSASVTPDKIFSITTVVIKEIEHGKVKKSDVTMKFPEGTEVTDAINGISYKTNAHGEPIPSTIQPLYGLDPSQVKIPEKKRGTVNYVMMIAGLIMIAIALYMQFNKRRRVKP